MFNILLAEDDKNLRKLMEIRLKDNKFNVYSASNGKEALDKLYNNPVDIMVVDIMMPIMDGYELVKTARQDYPNIPAIMVTAKDAFEDKNKGYSLGIDDYMVKPVNCDELVLRINAILRRAKIVSERKIVVNNTSIDYNSLTISDNTGKSTTLAKKEFSILFKLLSYPERVFTKSELFDEFWGSNSDTDENTIKVHINYIRNKIKDFPDIGIENIRGFGYKGVRNEKAKD